MGLWSKSRREGRGKQYVVSTEKRRLASALITEDLSTDPLISGVTIAVLSPHSRFHGRQPGSWRHPASPSERYVPERSPKPAAPRISKLQTSSSKALPSREPARARATPSPRAFSRSNAPDATGRGLRLIQTDGALFPTPDLTMATLGGYLNSMCLSSSFQSRPCPLAFVSRAC